MLTFNEFNSFLSVIEFMSERIPIESRAFEELLDDGGGIPKGLAYAQDQLVDALSFAMGDTNELIAWYIYDCNFGHTPLSVIEGGNEIIVDTPLALYNMLGGSID